VVLVPHGVRDVRVPAERTASEPDRGPLRLLYVGRLELRKGADLLLEVLPRLLEEFPTLEAVLVGQDDLPVDGTSLKQRFLAAHAGQPFLARIRFTGLVPDAELERAYAGCDLFVAPSRYESFGLVYLEAMRLGKPCIGTRAGGIPEVLEDGVNGVLVPPGDAVALEEAIRSLLGDPDARRRLRPA